MDSPAGEYCRECEENVGCKIYDNTPKKCLEFDCAYSQVEKASINLRPDKCGVVFERLNEDIFIGTVDPKLLELNEDGRNQINAFQQQGFSVVLFKQNISSPFIAPAKGRTEQEIWDIVQTEMKNIDAVS